MNMSTEKAKKWKYGSVAVLLTIVFVAFVILINVILSAVDSKVGLYIDLTNEKLFTITDATRDALAGIDQPVEIIFCKPADKVDDDAYLSRVKKLAEQYQSEFGNVSLTYYDIVADPVAVNQFKTTSATVIPNTSVIINCPSTSQFRVLANRSFYTFAQSTGNVFAFNGEMRLTSSILQVARPNAPVALFTTGHGESPSSMLAEMLYNAGYTFDTVDLKTQTLDPEKDTLVIISYPQNDFTGLKAEEAGQTNEIKVLNEYLENYGNLMVFLSPDTPELPELNEFLSDDWGISYTSGQIVADTAGNALDPDGYTIISHYGTDSSLPAYQVHKPISELASPLATISDRTTPLQILFDSQGYKSVSGVLYSSDGAQVLSGKNVVNRGQVPLMTLSVYSKVIDNVEKDAHVLVCGSAYFTNSAYVSSSYSNAFGNSDIIYSTLKLMGTDNAPVNIKFKLFDDTALSISQTEFRNVTLCLALILPAIVLIIGTVVWVKRKRS